MAEEEEFPRRPYADRCENCMDHVVDPSSRTVDGDHARCVYHCPGCGNSWFTGALVGAVEGWDTVRAAQEEQERQARRRQPTKGYDEAA